MLNVRRVQRRLTAALVGILVLGAATIALAFHLS